MTQIPRRLVTTCVAVWLVCSLGGIAIDQLSESATTRAFDQVFKVGRTVTLAVWLGYGIRRRLPYWTLESWMRFGLGLLASVLVGSIAVLIGAAVDYHWTWVGVAGSPTRFAWAAVGLASILAGGIGIGLMLARLSFGDPTRPFTWRPRRMKQHLAEN